jgi:transposase InsO family protein
MIEFIDKQRTQHGVEPICQQLPIAPSTYYQQKRYHRYPELRSERYKYDRRLEMEITRVYEDNMHVYGARKVWRQLHRENISVARCTVERLMNRLTLQGAVRGKHCKTTVSGAELFKPEDKVNRQFVAERPNQLWVADITYVSTWRGFVYVAFIIDVFARCIVGWRVSRTLHTELVLDALEQALWARKPEKGLIHHSDHGSQYLSIKYTERLTEAGIDASVGSVGDSYDNALAETINGLYKTEVIYRETWKTMESVEYATLAWVDWFNNRRLLEPIGNIPPVEFEKLYYDNQEESVKVA